MSSREISGRQKVDEYMLGKEIGKGSCSPEHAMEHRRADKSPAGSRSLKGQGRSIHRLSEGQKSHWKRERGREGVTANGGQEAC